MGNAEWQTWMILANFGYALRGHLLQAMAEQRAVPDGAATTSMEGRDGRGRRRLAGRPQAASGDGSRVPRVRVRGALGRGVP